MTRRRYHLTLDIPTDRTDESGVRRLRAALKHLWRAWSIRCVAVAPDVGADEPDPLPALPEIKR